MTETDSDLVRLVTAIGGGRVLDNYVIPGLRSTLLSTTEAGGKMRLFEMTREQEYDITPHDHRYSFQCCVLAGSVRNRRYAVQSTLKEYAGYAALPYDHARHALNEDRPRWLYAHSKEETFGEGDWYSMRCGEFHSIRFAKGTRVLLIEEPEEAEESWCLLPLVGGTICNTFIWRDWMMTPNATQHTTKAKE